MIKRVDAEMKTCGSWYTRQLCITKVGQLIIVIVVTVKT